MFVSISVFLFLSLKHELHPYWKFSNVLHFLLYGEEFCSVNHIAEPTFCGCNTGNPWLLQHDGTALFWHVKYLNIDTADCEFITKAKESTKCHQTLSSQVGSSFVLRPHSKIGKEPGHTFLMRGLATRLLKIMNNMRKSLLC